MTPSMDRGLRLQRRRSSYYSHRDEQEACCVSDADGLEAVKWGKIRLVGIRNRSKASRSELALDMSKAVGRVIELVRQADRDSRLAGPPSLRSLERDIRDIEDELFSNVLEAKRQVTDLLDAEVRRLDELLVTVFGEARPTAVEPSAELRAQQIIIQWPDPSPHTTYIGWSDATTLRQGALPASTRSRAF